METFKAVKKSTPVEVIQTTICNFYDCIKFTGRDISFSTIDKQIALKTSKGAIIKGEIGDYIIKGKDGEFYICDRTTFEESYYVVDSLLKI